MKDTLSFYVVIGKVSKWWSPVARRMTKSKPSRKRDEIAVKVTLEIPEGAFVEHVPEFSVVVPIDDVLQRGMSVVIGDIDADGLDKLAELIDQRRQEMADDER